uniref:Chromosome segregation ATPase n=1 Tax=Cyanothece sp. (strain PCC 7425 / ATCC 29141) TaxID=395961 RepID=B8HPI8_CYAP4
MKTGYSISLRKLVSRILSRFPRASLTPRQPTPLNASSGGVPAFVHLQTLLSGKAPWWIVPLLVSGSTGLVAGIWILVLPPLPDCQNLPLTASDGERLYCADREARQGNLGALLAALEMVSQWPHDHPLYMQANRLAQEWSTSVLFIARQKMDQGNGKLALDLLSKVPASTPVYQEAQALLVTWQRDAEKGKVILQQAQAALQEQNWQQATEQIRLLGQLGGEYWQQQSRQLIEQIAIEKQAGAQLQRAEDLAQTGVPEDLATAIRLATQVRQNTYAYDRAKKSIEQWSQELLAQVEERRRAGDEAGASALIEKIAPNSSNAINSPAFSQLGKAQSIARRKTLWDYTEALALVRQIDVNSPLHPLAQIQSKVWLEEIQSLAQIQLAQGLAATGQLWGYQLATQQVSLIEPERPQRQQAQQLITQWQQQIDRIEDRPWLEIAQALAHQRQLQQAIQVAQRIVPQRALYAQTQRLIYQWRGEIEAVVDRPLLNRAIELADQGNLSPAIATAAEIAPGRVLYAQAQDLIDEWLKQRDALEAAARRAQTPSTSDNPPEEANESEPAVEPSPIPTDLYSPSPEVLSTPAADSAPTPLEMTSPTPLSPTPGDLAPTPTAQPTTP